MNAALLNLRIEHITKRAIRLGRDALCAARIRVVTLMMQAGHSFTQACIAFNNVLRAA